MVVDAEVGDFRAEMGGEVEGGRGEEEGGGEREEEEEDVLKIHAAGVVLCVRER